MMSRKNWTASLTMCSLLAAAMLLLSTPAKAQGTGEKTYKAKCMGCHGPDGAGNTGPGKAMKARDFNSAEVKKETDAQLTEIIVKGKNKMPAYDKKLSEAEIKDVVAYVRSLCKK
jgi:mono/diheme cytochrome c family protein